MWPAAVAEKLRLTWLYKEVPSGFSVGPYTPLYGLKVFHGERNGCEIVFSHSRRGVCFCEEVICAGQLQMCPSVHCLEFGTSGPLINLVMAATFMFHVLIQA